ncbi:helix-turn-helix domain-containing protein [Roseateles aquatilis]|nr:helix-turn-helix transcriptional regulator [Roseateles aquatilis]
MSREALFTSLREDSDEFQNELARVAVAADLNVLLSESDLSRSELAARMGWTRARVTQVLSGEANLTIDTVAAVARALGHSFDLVFRERNAPRMVQPWERGRPVELQDDRDAIEFPTATASNAQVIHSRWRRVPVVSELVEERVKTDEGTPEWAHAA